jgi:Arc/MetJ-type ribon-helix-helix transcriptional regulator
MRAYGRYDETRRRISRSGPRYFPRLSYGAGGIVIAMATKKTTVTLAENQFDQIRDLVRAQTASSVSGFVQHAVTVALDDTAEWAAMLAEALQQTGGALSDDERAWADGVLSTLGARRRYRQPGRARRPWR